MPPITIQSPPALNSFALLADYQAQTPTSFFGAKPVLHYHLPRARLLAFGDQLSSLPIFGEQTSANREAGSAEPSNGDAEADEHSQASATAVVDVFVSSENLTLFNTFTSTGVAIPYPAISLHAIQRLQEPNEPQHEVQGLYMQIEFEPEASVTDDEPEIIEVTLLSPTSSDSATSAAETIQALFGAVSACSNLHPDPVSQEDEDMLDEDGDSRIVFEGNIGYEGISGLPGVTRGASDGGLPPPFPGSGGWITAENVGEYFDEEGNWIGGGDGQEEEEPLGEGAGRVRGRDEVDCGDEAAEGSPRVNGHGKEGSEDPKRPRVE